MQEQNHIPTLRLQLFGAPQIKLDETPVRKFVTRKAQALLIYLAVSARPQSRDALAGLLWRDLTGQQARNNLRRVLPNLRKLVGTHLQIEREVVAFDLTQPYWLDTEEFADTLQEAVRDANSQAPDRLAQALELYQDDFLAGFSVGDAPEFEAWALVQREDLRRSAIWGFDQLAGAYLRRGEYEAGVSVTNRLLTIEPWYEAGHHKQMQLLAQMGQRNAALAQYERCHAMLATEFGTEPSLQMTRLYENLKAGVLAIPGSDTLENEPIARTEASPSLALPPVTRANVDLGMVPRTATFYGRQYELDQLKAWILQEHCTFVAILGIGGVGKTTLASRFVRTIGTSTNADEYPPGFAKILWSSLLNAPPLEEVVSTWLQELSDHRLTLLPATLSEQLSLLFSYLRRQPCLLVLDNLESILQAGSAAGSFTAEHAEYALFLQQMGELEHKGCLLVTSRELPLEITRLERTYPVVRSLRLEGLLPETGVELLHATGLRADRGTLRDLVRCYSGNPLALRLVAEMILEHYQGNAEHFLHQETRVFEDIRIVLDQQLGRLSQVERDLLYWLTVEREPTSVTVLAHNLVNPPAHHVLLEAIRSLYRRALIEWAAPVMDSTPQGEVQFALQNVVLEYTTELLWQMLYGELVSGELDGFLRYALVKAQASDYVRAAQIRLLMQPVAQRLMDKLGVAGVTDKLRNLLETLRTEYPSQSGYGAANLLHIALHLHIQLEDWDFSRLPIWQADLRKGLLAQTNFSECQFHDAAFLERFDAILMVAVSPQGDLLAVGGADGNVHLWRQSDMQLAGIGIGSGRWIWALAFSPDGQLLASSGSDCIVHLWNVPKQPSSAEPDHVTMVDRSLPSVHSDTVFALAFSPDGKTLASASADQTICLWNVTNNALQQTLIGHTATIYAIAYAPNGRILVSASRDQTIRVWRADNGECLQVLTGHSTQVIAVHFSADGRWLITGSIDGIVQVWQFHIDETFTHPPARLAQTWQNDATESVALGLSPDGEIVALNGPDATIRLRKRRDGTLLRSLRGHADRCQSLAFHPNGRVLISGGWDQAIRFWDVATGSLLRTKQGYTNAINDLALSPDGQIGVSGNTDGTLCVWQCPEGHFAQIQMAHSSAVQSVAFYPDGQLLVSAGNDALLRVWRVSHTQLVAHQTLRGHHAAIISVVVSPSGRVLASGSEDQSVRLWDSSTGECLQVLHGHTRTVQALVFGPDDENLWSGSDDGRVYRWSLSHNTDAPTDPQPFAAIAGGCTCLAISPDGTILAGAGADHTIHLWRVADGKSLLTLTTTVNSTVYSLTFLKDDEPGALQLVSSSGTGALCYWDIDLTNRTYSPRFRHNDHRGSVRSIQVTPDNKTIVSGGADETIRLWDVDTGECRQVMHLQQPYAGMNIAGATGLSTAQRTSLTALGALTDPS